MAANPALAFETILGDEDNPEVLEERARVEAAGNARLLAAIDERESMALGAETDQVNVERATAIEYYLGRPFGNEIEGRSQVVSKDLFDTVEWIKPSLLRVFAGGDTVAEFAPQNEEDVEAARQEGEYIDYILQRRNSWFMLAHEWFTDALLTKNAYALAQWQETQEAAMESYRGLTEEQMTLIGMDETVQIVGHRAYQAPSPVPAEIAMQALAMGVQQAFGPIVLHDVDVRRVKSYGCVKICILPPERCLVASDARGMSVRGADFFEYWEYKTISQLRSEGLEVPDDVADTAGTDRGVIDEVRDSLASQSYMSRTDGDSRVDPSMRKVKARMIWLRCDHDGDGIAELRYVVAIGRTLFVNREASCIPVAAIVPYPMPHRHIGLSLFDVISDLQLIKSALLRSAIDNQFLLNNGRYGVDKDRVNLDDMAISRPGGMVRTDGPPGNSIMPFAHPQTVASSVAMIEYLDGIRQDRGGVSKPYAGSDLDAIKAQPGTIAQLTSAASQKIELIARIFGEGVKELFQIVHELTLTNATMQEKVELRGKWVTIDPRQWRKRSDMSLMVGLGVGNRQQQVVGLSALLQLQEKALGVGLTSLPKIYNALSEYVKAMGFSSGKQFFDEPQPGATFQPQSPPQVQAAQIKAQADSLKTQFSEMQENQRTQFKEMVGLMNDREDRLLRAFSEATERSQELRLRSKRGKRATD